MRMGTLIAVAVFCAIGMAQIAPAPPLRADRVMMLKKERTLQLLSHGKVIKTYKVALGGDPIGPRSVKSGDPLLVERWRLRVVPERVHRRANKNLDVDAQCRTPSASIARFIAAAESRRKHA
jgi:hypothetical protein